MEIMSSGINVDPKNYRGDMSNDPITISDRIKTWMLRTQIFFFDGNLLNSGLFFQYTSEKEDF